MNATPLELSAAAPPAYIWQTNAEYPGTAAPAVAASDMRPSLLSEMEEEAMDCSCEDWDGYGARAISKDAFEVASRFVQALPAYFPRPRVVPDPDGWFAFEWTRGRRKSVVVSVDPAYRVHYSALLGASDHYGSEPFFGALPTSVESLLQRLYRL